MASAAIHIPVPDPDEEPEREAGVVSAPALGYSILANLGDEKQITVQCFVDSEEALPSIHSKIDKAMAVVDRQKAKYRRRDLLKEIAEMEETLARQEVDLANLESNFEENQKALDNRITANVKEIGDIHDAAHARGRGAPQGADAAQVKALKAENEQLTEQKAKAAAERQQARDNIAVNVGRYNDAIAKRKEQIAECDALIDGS